MSKILVHLKLVDFFICIQFWEVCMLYQQTIFLTSQTKTSSSTLITSVIQIHTIQYMRRISCIKKQE